MMKPPIPTNEAERLQELISLELLDTENEAVFDDLVALASYVTGCPVSLISLVDFDRQWFKAKVGTEVTQTHRDISFCGHAIHHEEIFIVENALEDERFRDNPLVAFEPNIRFYAGQPLITTNGYRLGTLCAIDLVPRTLSPEQIKHLAALAKQVMQMMELRLVNRRQKLQTITQKQFLANISHEIRTPMTGVLGYASIARELLKSPDVSKTKTATYLENIERHSKHVLSIVGNILNLSKIESSVVELDTVDFSVKELKEHVISLFELEAQKKKVMISFSIAEDVPFFLSADFTRLKQILINLVGNALKFTDHGEVSITSNYDKETHILQFSVEDTGCGMTEVQSARLFKPFMQGDASIVTRYGGTGLGLAIGKQLCEAMGGELVLKKSIVNKGSEFVATVIAEPTTLSSLDVSTPAKQDAIHSTLRSVGGLANVLIADDSIDNRFLFNHYLNQFSIAADEAATGKEALNLIAQKNYDVIFLDLQMDDEDGFEILKKIRAIRHNVKVVAFTAHDSKEYREQFRVAGFNAYLPKPFDVNQLGEVLFQSLVYSQ